jgi:hypothetical protein
MLEEKVESAVKRIEQLNAENAALRRKCAELSNALNAKSEQFSTFQSDQSKIEEGILKALSRLNAVENVVLQASGTAQSVSQPQPAAQSAAAVPIQPAVAPVSVAQVEPVSEPKEPVVAAHPQNPNPVQSAEPSFDSMNVSEPVVQNVQPQSIPEEIEVPVQLNIQSPPVQNQVVESTPVSDSIAPDIGFEFGDVDSQVEPVSPEKTSDSEPSQPMFDIF